MKKIALIVMFALTMSVFSPVYSARPAEAFGIVGDGFSLIRGVVKGTVKGCWQAWNAPKGRKMMEAFSKEVKEEVIKETTRPPIVY